MYLGKENGDFIMAHRDNKSFVTKIIYQQNKKEEVKQYNIYGELTSATNQETSFDPRTRSWYFQTKEEEKAIWTDLYMFFTGKRPGITASYPLFNDNQTFEGVFGVDLELSEISEFLSFQKKYYNSKIIILNYKNEIVAQSGNIVFKTLKDGQIVPMHINEHGDDLIQESYKKITSIQKKVIVVSSAMSGVTNELIRKTRQISNNFEPSEYDVLVSSGEQMSCALISGRLNHIGIKSRSWLGWQVPIFTEGDYKKSRIVNIFKKRILKYLNSGGVPIITGFQGINHQNRLTTLERGGSDASAIMIAKFFKAEKCIIYTDVEGVYTTDPNYNKKAKKIKKS